MFYYIELLRALRALRVVGILLALGLLAGILFRLSFPHGPFEQDWAAAIERSPTAHIKRTRLPDGGLQTVVDDTKSGVHAVIVRHGDSTTMRVTVPSGSATTTTTSTFGTHSRGEDHAVNPSSPQHRESTTMTVVNPGNKLWLGMLFSITVPIGLLVATLLGGPLSKENNGHLELAWTKPVSREVYASAAVLVDVVTMLVSQGAALLALVLGSALWALPHVRVESDAALQIGLALVGPIAWYACVTALSTSLKRGPGATIGIALVVAIVTPVLAGNTQRSSWPIAQVVHAISGALSYIDPITYVWFQSPDSVVSLARSASGALSALAGLAIVYVVLALVQWRRVEA
jgi:hypothetical protein